MVPLSVIVEPSPAPLLPTDMSFSTGPQPLVAEVQLRSLKKLEVVPPPLAVVKVQVESEASALPARSLTPLLPPLTVAVYVELASRSLLGSSVAVWPA